MTEIWETALAAIRARVTEENFSTYFRPLRFARGGGDELVLEVDDPFFGDWVRLHYQDLLDDAVAVAAGRRVHIEVVAAPPPVVEPVALGSLGAPGAPGSPGAPGWPLAPSAQAPLPMVSASIDDGLAFPLNPHYTFDTYVIGPTNEMADAASKAVAQKPAHAYNPLFLYGGTGLGKTHLLHAIAHELRARDPRVRITYVSAEEFTNQVIKSIQHKEMDAFRARYRSRCDVLLVDDVHVLAGKERTQEEFFYTFNALHAAQKQIVLTSDKTPSEMQHLEDRLRSRFQWGLITDIKPPQFETRVAILQAKAERDGVELPEKVAYYLAGLVQANVRELEGALIRLSAYASIQRRPLTVEFAEEALRDIIENRSRAVTVDAIITLVAEHFDVKTTDLRGPRRHKLLSHPRSIAMYLCRKHTQASFPAIGRGFGGKDHSTVMAACRKVEERVEVDPGTRSEVEALERKLPN